MAKSVFYIPNGPKNLATLFPTINWANVEEYFVEVLDTTNALVATLPVKVLDACEDDIRIHFLNYLGGIDAINFKKTNQQHESKSDAFQRSPTAVKSFHSIGRTGVAANDSFVAITHALEEDVHYYDELLDSPSAWMEWKGTQGQPDSYIPVVILDKKSEKFKTEDRFYYEITVEFKLSHSKIIIRN